MPRVATRRAYERAWVCVWTTVCIAMFGRPAAADMEDKPATEEALRILVVAPALSSERVDEVYAGLQSIGLLTVGLDERAGVDRPQTQLSTDVHANISLDDVRARIAEARVAFRTLELDKAQSAIIQAREALLKLEDPASALDVFADVLVLEARVALQRGDANDARSALALLSRLFPRRETLHGGLYPPSLVEAYASARAWEQAQPEATVVVAPRVALFERPEITVDGHGADERRLRTLAGPHLVTVRAPSAVSVSRIVNLTSETPMVLEPFLAPRDAAERRAAFVDMAARAQLQRDNAALSQALERTAALCAARAVLFVHTDVAALWAPGRPLERLNVPPTASGRRIGQFTLSALQAPTREATGFTSTENDPTLRTGLWIALGGMGGVALLASGIVAALWAWSPPNPPTAPPRPVVVSCCVD